jgi:site-specific DNA-methyltransferase (adenine-specific)
MNIEKVLIKDIKMNPNNPRIIKDDKFKKLVKSIKDFPEMLEVRPIVVDDNMIVLGGNMRTKACLEAGLKEVSIIKFSNLSEDKKKEFIVKDNVGYGEWDFDVLKSDWDVDTLIEWGLDVPVFNTDDDVDEDDFEMSDEIKTDIVLGDLFEIGEHRLLCGDSTQTDTFEKLMQGEMGDMVITDPPYNVAYEGKTKDALTIENDSMGNDDFYQFLYDFYTAQSTVLKKGGAIYVWHASSEIVNFGKALVDAGFLLKQQLIWVKNQMVMGRQDYQWKHEPCLYGWLAGGSHKWYSDRKQTTVIEFDKPSRNGEHPTMKPIGLFAYQIGNSSKSGDIVIDAFGGSGTTMVACEQLKRKARVIEYDPKYCQVIVDRMLKLDPSIVIKRNGELYIKK